MERLNMGTPSRDAVDWFSRFHFVPLVLISAALLTVTACSGDAAESVSPPATPDASEVDRQASLFANPMRVCVQNRAATPIALQWAGYMRDNKGEYLKSGALERSLGQNAFDCAVSWGPFDEKAEFNIEGQPTSILNDGVRFSVRFDDAPKSFVLTPSQPVTFTWDSEDVDGRSIEARVTTPGDELVQYDQLNVYPIDIQVFEVN